RATAPRPPPPALRSAAPRAPQPAFRPETPRPLWEAEPAACARPAPAAAPASAAGAGASAPPAAAPGAGTAVATSPRRPDVRPGLGRAWRAEEDAMADALWVSLSGARARMRELDVVANNLANADSVG